MLEDRPLDDREPPEDRVLPDEPFDFVERELPAEERALPDEPLDFVEGGFHPGDDSRVVLAEDPVTASLLQARLIELGTGIRLRLGRY